jgi:heme exporter protein CcmD
MADLISLGGYGAYVWPAYAISAVTLAALTGHIIVRVRRARRRLADLENRHD